EPVLLGDTHTMSWDSSFSSGQMVFLGKSGSGDMHIKSNTCINTTSGYCSIEVDFSPLREKGHSITLTKKIYFSTGDTHTLYLTIKGSGIEGDCPHPEECCEIDGSIIVVDGRVLKEEIPVTGTDFNLVYSSARSPDYWTNYTN